MKNLIVTFTFAVVLICGTIVLNYMFPQGNKFDAASLLNNDLSDDDDQLCDAIFDSEGQLIAVRIYRWNTTANVRGALIDEYVAPRHGVMAYN